MIITIVIFKLDSKHLPKNIFIFLNEYKINSLFDFFL